MAQNQLSEEGEEKRALWFLLKETGFLACLPTHLVTPQIFVDPSLDWGLAILNQRPKGNLRPVRRDQGTFDMLCDAEEM